jgi:hypothetical protein
VDTIPIIDPRPYLAGEPGALQEAARQLRHALTEIGFYFIVNHGIPRDQIRGRSSRLRASTPAARREDEIRIDKHNVGYLPMKGDTLRTSVVQTVTKPNLNEALFVARDLPADHPDVVADKRFRSANQWPRPAGFRDVVMAIAMRWSGWCRSSCGSMPSRSTCRRSGSTRRSRIPVQAAHDALPPQPETTAGGRVRHRAAHRHQLPDGARAQRGARPRHPQAQRRMDGCAGDPDAFVVNGGQLLLRWTNDRFLATPHRAINRSGGERYALAFFCDATSTGRSPRCRPASGRTSRPVYPRRPIPTTWSLTRSAPTTCCKLPSRRRESWPWWKPNDTGKCSSCA